MKEFLESAGQEIHALDLVPSNGELGIGELAGQVARFAETSLPASFDLVGFSMGGIVGRYYLQRLGGLSRVRRFITLGSPHHGTYMGWLRGNPGAKQMRRGSAFLQDLNSDADVLRQVDFTSIWTPFDLMILPASSSVITAAKSIRVSVPAHPLLVKDKRVLQLVRDLLS